MNALILASVLLGQCCGGSCPSCGPSFAPPVMLSGPCPGCVCGPGCSCAYPGQCLGLPVSEPATVYSSLDRGWREGRRQGAHTVICYVGRSTGHPMRSNGVVYCRTDELKDRSGSGILITENLGTTAERWFWYGAPEGERAPSPSSVRTGKAGLRARK